MKYFTIFLMFSFWQFAFSNYSEAGEILIAESPIVNKQVIRIESELAQQIRKLNTLEKKLLDEEKKNQTTSKVVIATKLNVENTKEHVKGLEGSINNNNESLKSFVEKFSVIITTLNEVQSGLEQQISLSRNINNDINRTSIYSDWVQPIILSIIAAMIFWFFFSYLPENRRIRLIRKKVDINLFQIYNDLFFVFEIVLRPNRYSPSFEQEKIRSGNLTDDDLFLGLQNKCLNETYCYDKNIVKALNPIGKDLYKKYSSIENNINLIFHFNSCLSPYEILLLEDIRTTINVYGLDDYDRSAFTTVAGKTLYPPDPSMSYMAKNLFELYEKTMNIQSIIFETNLDSRNLFLYKLMYEFSHKNYKKCVKLIENGIKKYPQDNAFLKNYLFACQLEMNQIDSARKTLKIIMKNKPNLISCRTLLKGYIKNESVSDIFKENYSEQEILEMNDFLKQEDRTKKFHVDSANELIEYYKQVS